tara:strand:- start:323 stop:601 length:279 start_codon:yes stop_codon:yes gene_type:complete
VTPVERDNIILEAALEWGADATYDIRNGTIGPTLYIDCSCKEESSYIRHKIPAYFHGLYVVVTYPTDILTYEEADRLYDEQALEEPDLYHPA